MGITIIVKKKKKIDNSIILSFISKRIAVRIKLEKNDHGQ